MEADAQRLRDKLRRSVRDAHRRVDHHPLMKPLLDQSLRIEQYLDVLLAFDHFYRFLTPWLESKLALYGAGYACADRRPWLQKDLEFLDAAPSRRFPEPKWRLPAVTGAEELIGLLYVVEGSLLGGQHIARHLRAALGLTPERGACFFNGLGDETAQRWSAFLAFAEAGCAPEREASAIAAACGTFTGLERGFDEIWVHFRSDARAAIQTPPGPKRQRE